jgi:hypothetical protein
MRAFRSSWAWVVLGVALGATWALLPQQADAARAQRRAALGAPQATTLDPAQSSSAGPSEVIFPPETRALHFDHALHDGLDVPCLACHPGAATSRSASDDLGAAPNTCDGCHKTNHRLLSVTPGPGNRGACVTCHVEYSPGDGNLVQRSVVTRPNLRFDHRAHHARNTGCGQCHGAVERVRLATREQLPRMLRCLRCHDQPDESRGDAGSGCPTCHLTLPGGRMKTQFASGTLVPPAWLGGARHGADFEHTHGAAAANDSRFCARCHAEDECQRCHDGRVRPRSVHPNDFLSMHAVAAQQSARPCSSCHRVSSFCTTCHRRAGVTATGPARLQQGPRGRVHPASDVFTTGPVTSRHHATEARRNLTACVGCHVERDCVACHGSRAGPGVGVNPHPPSFASRCGSALRRNPRPCLVCHEPADPVFSRCR